MKKRPFIGIRFRCCNVYMRVYLNKAGTAYRGHCPKCSGKITVKVSPTGERTQFFEAG